MFPYCRRKFLGAETTSYQTFAQVFLLHLIYDVGWSISPTYTPQNPMIDHHFPHEDGPGLPMSRCHVRQNHWSTSMVFSPKIEYPRNHCFSPIKHHHLLKDLDDFRVSHGDPHKLKLCWPGTVRSNGFKPGQTDGHAEAMNHRGYYCYTTPSDLWGLLDFIGTCFHSNMPQWKG